MHYIKLFLIVIVGSIGIWFAVYKLVASTDRITESFTVDSVSVAQRAETEAAKAKAKTKEEQSSKVVAHDDRSAKINGEIMTVTEQSESTAEELALIAELKSVAEEGPAIQINVDKEVVIEVEKLQAGTIDEESELSEADRADSDADLQPKSGSNGDKDNATLTKNSQNKPLELDRKLLDTTKPDDAITKTESDTIRALDIAYAAPSDTSCVFPGDSEYPRIGVRYRPSSYAIKGQSLTSIDKLIAVHKKCGGKMLVIDNKVSTEESDERLVQLRQDEVKYYLLQRRVPKDDIIFSNN